MEKIMFLLVFVFVMSTNFSCAVSPAIKDVKRTDKCARCKGKGHIQKRELSRSEECPFCIGRGSTRDDGHRITCKPCRGSGVVNKYYKRKDVCIFCNGVGKMTTHTLKSSVREPVNASVKSNEPSAYRIGQMWVYPKDLGEFSVNNIPYKTIVKINDNSEYIWRLPTLAELKIIFDNLTKISPIRAGAYWSSECYDNNPKYRSFATFVNGSNIVFETGNAKDTYNKRCNILLVFTGQTE